MVDKEVVGIKFSLSVNKEGSCIEFSVSFGTTEGISKIGV